MAAERVPLSDDAAAATETYKVISQFSTPKNINFSVLGDYFEARARALLARATRAQGWGAGAALGIGSVCHRARAHVSGLEQRTWGSQGRVPSGGTRRWSPWYFPVDSGSARGGGFGGRGVACVG